MRAVTRTNLTLRTTHGARASHHDAEAWGEPLRCGALWKVNANVTVSDAEFSDLPRQIADALAFLRDSDEQLRAARVFPGVDHLAFDFPIEARDVIVQSDVFPAALLALLGTLGIDLEVTRYPQLKPE